MALHAAHPRDRGPPPRLGRAPRRRRRRRALPALHRQLPASGRWHAQAWLPNSAARRTPIPHHRHLPHSGRSEVPLPDLLRSAQRPGLCDLSGQAHRGRQLPHRLYRPYRTRAHRGRARCDRRRPGEDGRQPLRSQSRRMSARPPTKAVSVNGRSYRMPTSPVVVVCVDGSEPGYIERAIEAGEAPYFRRMLASGTNRLADCVVPSFTNPNNLSIVTGPPPDAHPISGHYFFDPTAHAQLMINDPRLLRADTIFKAFQAEGARIAIITAKDKLRRLLAHGLVLGPDRACSFSAETA